MAQWLQILLHDQRCMSLSEGAVPSVEFAASLVFPVKNHIIHTVFAHLLPFPSFAAPDTLCRPDNKVASEYFFFLDGLSQTTSCEGTFWSLLQTVLMYKQVFIPLWD